MISTKQKLTALILLTWLFPASALAVSVFFESQSHSFHKDDEFLVGIFLNTEKQSINAIEGRLTFPDNLLEIKEIRNGDSVINFWVEKPHIIQSGALAFSGITPGGVSAPRTPLFSIIFHVKKAGKGSLAIDSARILQNDGKGTEAKVKTESFSLSITETKSLASSVEKIVDIETPEDFKPIIGKDPNIFDGKYFIVFATQDKGSGIDHYEVDEGGSNSYTIAESPYVLRDQSLTKKVYIKAVDKNGNQRVVTLEARNRWLYPLYAMFAILLLIVIVLSIRKLRKKWSRFTN